MSYIVLGILLFVFLMSHQAFKDKNFYLFCSYALILCLLCFTFYSKDYSHPIRSALPDDFSYLDHRVELQEDNKKFIYIWIRNESEYHPQTYVTPYSKDLAKALEKAKNFKGKKIEIEVSRDTKKREHLIQKTAEFEFFVKSLSDDFKKDN
jgi:hypothetical protein